jgi:hypothetical protein
MSKLQALLQLKRVAHIIDVTRHAGLPSARSLLYEMSRRAKLHLKARLTAHWILREKTTFLAGEVKSSAEKEGCDGASQSRLSPCGSPHAETDWGCGAGWLWRCTSNRPLVQRQITPNPSDEGEFNFCAYSGKAWDGKSPFSEQGGWILGPKSLLPQRSRPVSVNPLWDTDDLRDSHRH